MMMNVNLLLASSRSGYVGIVLPTNQMNLIRLERYSFPFLNMNKTMLECDQRNHANKGVPSKLATGWTERGESV